MMLSFAVEIKDAKTGFQNQCQIYNENYVYFEELYKKLLSANIDEETKAKCKTSVNDLNKGKIYLIFCGQLKSGKSHCIIEFLSGKLILPSRSTPATKYFTHIFYSDKPTMFSETSNNLIHCCDFDGKTVANILVGREDDSKEIEQDAEKIYHVGTPNTFQEKSFHIIDTPGLNETKEISDAFYVNIKKLNPQLVVYIFDAGPKFTVTDEQICTNLIHHLRKKLNVIFLFNKYDCAFELPKVFQQDSSEEEGDGDEEEEEDDDDDDDESFDSTIDENHLHKYEKDYKDVYEVIKTKVDLKGSNVSLFGYSSKLVKDWRLSRDNNLPFLLKNHLNFLLEIGNQINIISIDAITELFEYCKLYLYTRFKSVYSHIISTRNKDFHGFTLKNSGKEKLLSIYDKSHSEIKIQPPHPNKFELESSINEIIKSQEKRLKNESTQKKFEKITKSLIGFLINRYNNLFSNIIHDSLDHISFDLFCNELKINDLENHFPHTFCTLKYHDDVFNLHLVIEGHFNDQYLKNFKETFNSFQSIENYKEQLKNNLKYDTEFILPKVEDYLKIKLDNERKKLQDAIENKTNEIISTVKKTDQETESEIKEIIMDFRKWLILNNNYIKLLKNNSQIQECKKEIFAKIIDHKLDTFSINDMIIKREYLDLDEINCKNFVIIQYFLRTQIISNSLLECFTFFHEEKKEIYYITNLGDYLPLRVLLPKLEINEKKQLIGKLSDLIDKLHELSLPLDNFGPDMVFVKLCSKNGIEVRLSETSQNFKQWQYTLNNGDLSDEVFFKYPYYLQIKSIEERNLSMIYSFSWTVIIILYGACENIINGNILENKSYKVELNEKLEKWAKDEIYETCKNLIDCSFKRPYDNNTAGNAYKLLNHLKKTLNDESDMQ